MAVRINRDKLTDTQKNTIRKYLYMQPKKIGFFKKSRFVQTKDPILMYHIDKPNNEVVVPYAFGNKLLNTHINSERVYPDKNYKFIGELRSYQIEVAKTANEHLNTTGSTILGLYASFGKTILAAYLSSFRKGLTLVVHPIKMVQDGWKNTFERYTTAKVWVNNGKILNTLNDYNKYDVIVTQNTQFHKIPKEVLEQVKILIIDEAHMFCVPDRIHCLLGTNPLYIMACTATLERRDGMESIIHSVCGTNGIFIKNPKKFTVFHLLTGIKTQIQAENPWSNLVKDLCENPIRNAMIIDLVETNLNYKIMILTWSTKHAQYLKKVLSERGTSVDILVGNKNTYKDSRVLIGSYSKIGTGFDECLVCPDWGGKRSNLMIMTGSTKSLQALDQWTGRIFRADFPNIFYLDDDNRISKNHWRDMRKWFESSDRNGTIIDKYMNKNNNNQQNNNQQNINKIHNNMVKRIKLKILPN